MKKKILLVINVPTWVTTTVATFKYAWRSVQWIFNPPRCEGCGARMHATHYHIEYIHPDNGTRLLVENHGSCLCPKCIGTEVLSVKPKLDRELNEYDVQDTCDCCQKENTTAYKFYTTDKIRLHFCLQWWNGFHICRECIYTALTKGKVRTSIGVMDGTKHYDTGANGLRLNPKTGKVMLFRKVKW
jgi:hypothetical protein